MAFYTRLSSPTRVLDIQSMRKVADLTSGATKQKSRTYTDDDDLFYINSSRIRKMINFLVALIILALLGAPIFSMYKLSSMNTRRATYGALCVLMVSSLVFVGTTSILTSRGFRNNGGLLRGFDSVHRVADKLKTRWYFGIAD